MVALPADLDRLLHDLRGPLNAIFMHLELLRRQAASDPGARASLDALQQEVSRLAIMLPAVFHVVALEPGLPSVANLRALVEQAIAAQNLGPVTVADGQWPDVRGDPPLLTTAIGHLVRNALQSTDAAGPGRRPPHVGFMLAPPDHVILVVRDWGRGLRTTNPRVLIRLVASREPDRASAGLVAVERIARLHRGGLEFASPPDGGAEVRLRLPAG